MISAQKWAENLADAEKLYHSNYNDYGENLAFKMSVAPCQITGNNSLLYVRSHINLEILF